MDKKVLIRIVRSDNKMFTIGDGTWKIPSDGLDGWGSFENSITTTTNALIDGDIFEGERVGKVDRSIEAICESNSDTYRHQAIAFFIPKMEYDVYIAYKGTERWARGRLYKFNCPTQNIYDKVKFTVTFLFANPYLNSVDNFGQDIAEVIPMAGFPYVSVVTRNGSPSGKYNFNKSITIYNDGDVNTNFRVEFSAKGDVVNPVFLVNDKYVRVLDTMKVGDIIIIDFEKLPPTVKKNGVNIIGRCDRTSTFDNMYLLKGSNTVGYDADNGTSSIKVSLYYNKKYCTL